MRLLKRLPLRRVELLASLLWVLGCFSLIGILQSQHVADLAQMMLMITLEIIVPVTLGLLSAGLLAGDPVLDVLLSAHRPAWQTLLERLLWIGAVGIFLSSSALLLAKLWSLPVPKIGSAQLYIGLSPLVFYMGLSSTAALLRGKLMDGVLATLGGMGISIMTLTQIPQLCTRNLPGAPCIGWLASPIMTLGNPADAYWPLNRLIWLFLGLLLLGISLRLTKREEPLLRDISKE